MRVNEIMRATGVAVTERLIGRARMRVSGGPEGW